MNSLDQWRKQCLKQQTELRRLMSDGAKHDRAIRLFLTQHALLHSAKMARTEAWSFEDAVLDGLTDDQLRRLPRGGHSIAWLIWHIARCEDITLNLLIANRSQVLHTQNWLKRLNITARDTGNAMDAAETAAFNRSIDIAALRAYRLAVGRRTRAIAQRLTPSQLRQPVDPARIRLVLEQGAVLPAAHGIADYWAARDFAGLLLMPATRHNLIHLNEALRVKTQLAR